MSADETLRHLFTGADPRRMTLDPTDRARAEGLVAQYGGVIEIRTPKPGQMVFQWLDHRGQSVMVAGESAAECLTLMQEAITADEIDYLH